MFNRRSIGLSKEAFTRMTEPEQRTRSARSRSPTLSWRFRTEQAEMRLYRRISGLANGSIQMRAGETFSGKPISCLYLESALSSRELSPYNDFPDSHARQTCMIQRQPGSDVGS